VKYRGNFEVDACERQFEKKSVREARKLKGVRFDAEERKAGSYKARGRERARERGGKHSLQERD
jgi:hypothetical protein